uniref:Uncharacterized protein n=1 Tax=Phytophthora fragariae TaxID=53985 RepID=A0A6A3FKM3_9STRA|nr:hypothetical protein PF009_g4655 [Phytophthora fragariae]
MTPPLNIKIAAPDSMIFGGVGVGGVIGKKGGTTLAMPPQSRRKRAMAGSVRHFAYAQTRRAPRTHSRHTTQERLERASRLLPALCI